MRAESASRALFDRASAGEIDEIEHFEIEPVKTKAVNLRGRPEDMLLMALTW